MSQRSERRAGQPHQRAGTVQKPFVVLSELVNSLADALGDNYEVVLHDFSQLPNSIIAIGGNLTGRKVGGPATDVLLRALRSEQPHDLIRYQTSLPDGRLLRSSTLFIRDATGQAIGGLCLNFDTSDLRRAHAALNDIMVSALERESTAPYGTAPPTTDGGPEAAETGTVRGERFAQSVQDLTHELVGKALAEEAVPVELMQKQHKLRVVQQLDEQGLFLIRDAVDYVATRLKVSRYTIYKYLAEIKPSDATMQSSRRATTQKMQ